MEELNTECIGMDIGDKWCVIRGVDAIEKKIQVVRKERVECTQEEIESYFKKLGPTRVVIEASTHSPWISRLLDRLGHDVVVANPRRVQLISQNKYKDDETDAELLARLGRADADLMSPIEHRPEQRQADLVYIRMRAVLVDARSSLVTAVRGQVKSFGGRIPTCSTATFGKKAREHLPEILKEPLELVLAEIQQLTARIKQLEKKIDTLAEEKYPAAEHLSQIKGVGKLTALCFVLVCQDPENFRTNRSVGSYTGLCPGRNQSGNSDPDCRITKAGDKYLRKLLVQNAHWILTFGELSDLKIHGQKIIDRGGKHARSKGAVAVARKLAVLMMHMWRTGDDWDPLYNAKKRGDRIYQLENSQPETATT